ncbi:TPA: hypothetical protein R3V32_001073 [Enterobacter cloacae]|nr:hypothetical protein [Enterobacter cloacae]
MFKVEYLFVFKKDSKIKSDIEGLIYNLKGNKELKFLSEGCLEYKGNKYTMIINSLQHEGDVSHKSCEIVFKSNDVKIDSTKAVEFLTFETEITTTLLQIQNESIYILQNTAAAFIAKESYVLINNVENKMRKLITLFMTANVGVDWEVNSTPKDVEDSIKNKVKLEEDITSNILFYVDFNRLSDFLFKSYKTMNDAELHNRLSSGKITLEEIKERCNPKSNWARYFQAHIQTKDTYINKQWNELYQYRNSVAHNRSISEADYSKISELTKNLERIIDQAIVKANFIELTEQQKEQVTNVAQEEINEVTMSKIAKNLNKTLASNLLKLTSDGKYLTGSLVDGLNYLTSSGVGVTPSALSLLSNINVNNNSDLKKYGVAMETDEKGCATGKITIISAKKSNNESE